MRRIDLSVVGVLLPWLLAMPMCLNAQAPTDEELKALEQQIEKQEAKQAEAKKKAEAEAKRKAEEAAQQRTAEEQKKKEEEAAKQAAEAEAQRRAEEEKHRMQLEQQQREEYDKELRDADAAMNRKDYAQALQAYTRSLTIFPNDATALAGQAKARELQETCSALMGEWDWILGSTMIASADGTLQGLSLIPNHGQWECTDPSQRRFTLRWVVGGWVDTATLSADGNTLDVVNNVGIRFQGQRKGSRKKSPAPNPLYGR